MVFVTVIFNPGPDNDIISKLGQELTDGVIVGVVVLVGVTVGVTDEGVLVVVLVGV